MKKMFIIFYTPRYRVIPGNQMTGGMNIDTISYQYDVIPPYVLSKVSYPKDPVPSPIFPGMI